MRIRSSIVLFLSVAALSFAQQTGEWYMGKPIKDIAFEGLKHVSSSELDGVIEPFIGRLFNDELFFELQGRLYALEYFDFISPSAVPADSTGSAVIIKFKVTEKPVVSRINFEGNDSVRRTELLDIVSIKINDVVNQLKLKADEQAIRNKYLEKGYPDVSVQSRTDVGKDDSVELTFMIEEGEKVAIEELLFEGNSVFSERSLRGVLSLKAKSLLNDGAFQEAKLLADRNALTQYYRDRGYLDAEVVDVVREIHRDEKDRNLMTITFKINEGRIYTLQGINFEGNNIFSTKQLSDLVYSKPGQIANARKLSADFERVLDLYYENGYIYNTITRREERNEETGSIAYTISIVERARSHIENIIIRGNEKTKDEVILREIPLETGDVFSKTKVFDAMRNLYNLQYFSMVTPDTPQGSAENLMNLVFTVEEQSTADVAFGMTFSGSSDPDAFPISGFLTWNERNFLGTGNAVGLELNASPDTQNFSAKYTHRWLFGLPLSGGFEFGVKHTEKTAWMDNVAPYFTGDEDYAYPDGFESYKEFIDASRTPDEEYLMDYDEWSLYLNFSTGYRFYTTLGNLGVGGGVSNGFVKNFYDSDLYRPFDATLRDRWDEWIPSNYVWTSVSIDDRDIYYDPSDGYYAIQRFGYYGILPVEREYYLKTSTKAEYFHTLFNIPLTDVFNFKGVFGIHSGLSLIYPQWWRSDVAEINETNKLSIDGMFIGRGWYSMRLNRGLALWENWAELRFPIAPGILAMDWFMDAAAVKDTPQEFFNDLSVEDFRFSLGAGMRFTIPQFPFRFSLAKRFQVVDGEVEWVNGGIGAWGLDFVISFALSTY